MDLPKAEKNVADTVFIFFFYSGELLSSKAYARYHNTIIIQTVCNVGFGAFGIIHILIPGNLEPLPKKVYMFILCDDHWNNTKITAPDKKRLNEREDNNRVLVRGTHHS